MKFVKYFPTERLKPYIKYFAVSENQFEREYKVLPSSGLVIGFQYKGQLSRLISTKENILESAGITDSFKIFKNSADVGTVLIYFTETGFIHFASHPANELFNLSLSLEDIFEKKSVREIEEKLATFTSDTARIKIVEHFLISQLKEVETDKLIVEAINLIYKTNGTIRISELNKKLFVSQSVFEKRFRKVVGTTAKKFASIIRFNSIIENFNEKKTLTEICYDNNYFDQSHFIKDFKQFTGDTPEKFKRFL
ncbi:MAG: helix-turn-helix domain-containing protein [Pedobacter sp.]|nr:MAG: helix-turn-helix domain-containing protein [Pedobacter sp.]